jgi:hypothetical protein
MNQVLGDWLGGGSPTCTSHGLILLFLLPSRVRSNLGRRRGQGGRLCVTLR